MARKRSGHATQGLRELKGQRGRRGCAMQLEGAQERAAAGVLQPACCSRRAAASVAHQKASIGRLGQMKIVGSGRNVGNSGSSSSTATFFSASAFFSSPRSEATIDLLHALPAP